VSSPNSKSEYLTEAEFRAWHGCLLFTDRAMRALDEELSAAHGISIKEFDVLITLYNAPDNRLRMTELADRVTIGQSQVTNCGNGGILVWQDQSGPDGTIVTGNHIARIAAEDDRRSFFATLTTAGHQRLNEARPTHNEVVRARLTRRLTPAQLATLGALWETILDA